MRRFSILAMSFLTLLLFAITTQAATRTALVIGNSDYAFGKLLNPGNDAELVARTLEGVGFTVTTVLNADRQTMQKALLTFSRDIRDKDTVGLFYYAGHGAQTGGQNYLIPIDADIKAETELKIFGINVDEFVATLERADGRTNIVILDSCRNNPFGSGSRAVRSGLAAIDAPAGTIVAFSTAPGQVALDGEGSNSPYAASLVKAIATPGISIEQTFKVTRREVLQTTQQTQTPWENTSLTGDFFFTEATPVVEKVEPAPPVEEQVAVATPAEEPAAPAAERNLEQVDVMPRIIPVGNWPEGLVMADGGLWIAESGSRQISKIDLESGRVVEKQPVGRLPVSMAADPEGNVYAAVYTDGRIFRRGSDGEGKALASIKTGYLNGMSFGARAIYTTAVIEEGERKTILSRIDPQSGKVTKAPLPISGEARAFVMAQDAPWILFTDGTVAMYDASTLDFVSSTASGGFMWSMGANLDAVFVGGREQQQAGKSVIHRHAQGNPEDKTAQVLDSEELINTIAANDNRVVVLGVEGDGWVLDAISLTPLKRFTVGAAPKSAIIDQGKLYVTTHQGQGENGSVLVFDGLLN